MSDTTESPPAEQPEWLVHSCPHCEGSFKSREADKTPQMACPHCGEIVQLRSPEVAFESAEGEGGESTNDDASIDDSEATDTEEEGEEIDLAPEGELRKKRRKTLKEYDLGWESDTNPDDADSDEEVREYYEEDPDDPDAIRVRRVRRKKLLSKGQKVIRYAVIGAITAVLVATGIVGAIMWFQSVKIATDDGSGYGEIPIAVGDMISKALESERIPTIVNQDEIDACVAIMNSFLDAKTVDQKLAYVRNSTRVRPLMEAWYAKRPATEDRIVDVPIAKKIVDSDRHIISIAAKMGVPDSTDTTDPLTGVPVEVRFLSFEQTSDSILLDWATSVGYQEIPLEEFKSKRPTEPVEFRVKAALGNDYFAPFNDTEKYQSLELSYPGIPNFRLVGYVEKASVWGAKFLALMEFEKAPSVIVDLRYPPDSSSDFHVEVTGIVHNSWYY